MARRAQRFRWLARTPVTFPRLGGPQQYAAAIAEAVNDPAVGCVLAIHVPPIEDVAGAGRSALLAELAAVTPEVPVLLVAPGGASGRLPVFDGYTRFDVTLSFKGLKQVRTQGYAGPVAVCDRYIAV